MTSPQPKITWSNEVADKIKNFNNKCVIGLDRDGVLNVDLGTYVTTPDKFEPIEGSLEAVARLRALGHKIVIISNQGGIEKGIMSQDDVDRVHDRMFELLGAAGCHSINSLYYSASSRKDDMYAKPNTGMFKRCEKENPDIKFSKGYYVGDKISDLKAAMKAGARPILVRTGYGEETEALINKRFTYQKIKKATKIFDNLAAFVDSLEKSRNK